MGPVVVHVGRESRIWVCVLWHWTSDVWLWVLAQLNVGPVVVHVGREGRVWVCVLWHWTANVWLWVLLTVDLDISIKLGLSPIIMEEA